MLHKCCHGQGKRIYPVHLIIASCKHLSMMHFIIETLMVKKYVQEKVVIFSIRGFWQEICFLYKVNNTKQVFFSN